MNPLSWLERYTQQAVVSIKNLAGQTACSYLVTLENGGQYILRSQTPRATTLGVDYRQEAIILEAIRPLGFVPMALYADHNGAILGWQEGKVPECYNEEILLILASHLAKLHTYSLQAVNFTQNIAKLDLKSRCQFLWSNISPSYYSQIESPQFKPISPFGVALCHHDVHLANLVQLNESLTIIDWEYAAISDPALDIALFFRDPQLSSEHKRIFLKCYLSLTGFNSSRFAQKMLEYRPYIDYLYRLWLLI